MDIRTVFVGEEQSCDWLLAGGDLESDDGLETAVVLSLFTDRLADRDDVVPDGSANRRGWWGDDYADQEGDHVGSKLWLLSREKQLPSVLERLRRYAEQSLRWLVEDGIARSVTVQAEFPRAEVVAYAVTIERAIGGPVVYRFETFWNS
ncbi:phage GP46 family protein [Pseudoxanthomonas sp. 22568]|uniref:phage GP46 family protein n=1 Tax=Pseudoxanthomonas sp. 22568 TaxID=3453945 RepID=UPI003F85B905